MKMPIAAIALFAALGASAAPAKTPCEPSPLLVGKCFWLRGRLTAYNGAPTFRIWPVGSRRLLGVNGPNDERDGRLETRPDNVVKAAGDGFRTAVYADYRLCPFTRARPGRMQFVCIARADRLVAQPRP